MKKQASFGSILETFKNFYPQKTAGDESQGSSEKSVSIPSVDAEADELKPADGTTSAGAHHQETGVASGEKLEGAPSSIPETKKEYSLVSPSTKLASEDSIDTLIQRLSANLTKVAEGTAEVVSEPAKVAAAPVTAPKEVEIDLDKLASKTAAFLQASELGYKAAKALFAKTASGTNSVEDLVAKRVMQLKTAGFTPVQITEQLKADGAADAAQSNLVEESRSKIASFVASTVEEQVKVGTLSAQQGEVLLTSLGYETQTAKIAAIEKLVDQKVASLKEANPSISDEEIMSILQKDAEADAAALAQDPAAAGGLPPEMAGDPAAAEAPAGPVDPAAQGGAPAEGGAPDEGQLAQLLQQAIGELQQAVEAGQLTEEQALQILQESGLDVQGLLAAAQGGGAAGGAPAPEGGAPVDPAAAGGAPVDPAAAGGLPPEMAAAMSPEGGAPAPEEAAPKQAEGESEEKAEGESKSEEKSEGKKEEKSEEKSEKKEASLQALIKAADAAYTSGALSKEQAASMVAALK